MLIQSNMKALDTFVFVAYRNAFGSKSFQEKKLVHHLFNKLNFV